MFPWVPQKVAPHDSLKTAAWIIMKFHIWIRYLLTYVFSYITFWYLDPKMGFGGGGRTNGNYRIFWYFDRKSWFDNGNCQIAWNTSISLVKGERYRYIRLEGRLECYAWNTSSNNFLYITIYYYSLTSFKSSLIRRGKKIIIFKIFQWNYINSSLYDIIIKIIVKFY